MSEVIRNDIFHFASTENVPTGFYRLCKQKPVNPLFFLPNLLVVAEGNNDAIPPCF
ncbi:TPA: His-Xaa-Ser system radical SAM maturase HxsC, partial [Escherichia coli]